jgi:hypothetical protein
LSKSDTSAPNAALQSALACLMDASKSECKLVILERLSLTLTYSITALIGIDAPVSIAAFDALTFS